MKRNITNNVAEIKVKVRKYNRQLHANLDNLNEMEKFLEIYNLSILSHEALEKSS